MQHAHLPEYSFYIDITGMCNLTCPSCPNGNGKTRNHRFMTLETFKAIIVKAKRECNIGTIGLYNWMEPLIHPRIADFIRFLKQEQIQCGISSNLNIWLDAQQLMRANPDSFRISVSAFRQENYQRTHRGGDIEKVKRNMCLLAASRVDVSSTTDVEVYYHRYLHNLEDEALMRSFVIDLGFRFTTGWASFFPLEKRLTYLNPELKLAKLTSEDIDIIKRLALPLDAMKDYALSLNYSGCELRTQYINIDSNADVHLCCGTYGEEYKIAPFLTTPLSLIQSKREAHPLCGKCMSQGNNANVSIVPEAMSDEVAWQHINISKNI